MLDQLRQLHSDLRFQYEADHEQEVDATVLPLIDAVVADARDMLPEGSTLGDQLTDFVTVAAVEDAEPIRVAAVMYVVGQLMAVYERAEKNLPRVAPKSIGRQSLEKFRRPRF